MCVDQFGIPWMVNCPMEQLTSYAARRIDRGEFRPRNSNSREVSPPRRLIQPRTGAG